MRSAKFPQAATTARRKAGSASMKFGKRLLEGLKLAVLFGIVALVVWSMPEHRPQQGQTAPELATGISH
jgi:hypothetical protein